MSVALDIGLESIRPVRRRDRKHNVQSAIDTRE
jgi:hypothetical protein